MYYQNYEDYMRQVLGYPMNDPSIYETYDYRNQQTYEDTYSSRNQVTTSLSEEEIKGCYPEIYHLVYPMVCKVCETNTQPITKELIEKMTDEVYNAMEDTSTVVNIRVDTPKPEVRTEKSSLREEGRSKKRTLTPVSESSISKTSTSVNAENRGEVAKLKETRQQNSALRDLITILLLQRLFGNRPGNPRPPRPPFPGGPGRPPFPGGPGPGRPPMRPGGPGRPPMIQPRDYPDYLEF